MWQDVLETYRCLISCREKCPGMSLEEVFKPEFDSVDALKREYAWLQQQASAAKTAERAEEQQTTKQGSPLETAAVA